MFQIIETLQAHSDVLQFAIPLAMVGAFWVISAVIQSLSDNGAARVQSNNR